ncbi:MAG: S-adenosylmethionine:tRNA ribosyltransferase-isomerase [Bacteroidales bacterium]|nr:S-adenosylmethionine:tRNA ribosyltransferase-isomerase [Bacteroidales bacterium]
MPSINEIIVHPGKLKIEEYDYNLNDAQIAKYPLVERDSSKLLYLDGGIPKNKRFKQLTELIPSDSLLLFNKTKVVNARINFKKITGAIIEVFCLEPVEPVNDFQIALQQNSPVVWKCLVGNAKRWKSGLLELAIQVEGRSIYLIARKKLKLSNEYLIEFSWNDNEITFSQIINAIGMIPIPPYLNRKAEESDNKRYQTIYAEDEGSVAAPTAGLHFTESIFNALKIKGIEVDSITLHVGAGTFKPVVSPEVDGHEMHVEKIVVQVKTLEHLLEKINSDIIPVGTTSMRTLESLYWMAIKLLQGDTSFSVGQWDAYKLNNYKLSNREAIEVLLSYFRENDLSEIHGETRLMIAPGYKFKFATGLITNFHQPKSTLLLLVSALVGDDWKRAYEFALEHEYRFLSYGDSCFFKV